ncbi:MAG TPA: M20/M25/M40 family metallo-hydrolase [Vicinamibacteria bacterium]|nr:M20/M25/M40 family metallo-hydrolase [Vicinamibacteria bacterium]
MSLALGVVLAAAIDGEAALRHASALAALGPHPWGSTRNEAAALYVAAQMRNAGLDAVELQRFERGGTVGTNVVGTLRGRGGELIVIGAHHDTVPGSPGAYDDSAGVALLLEVARALAATPSRERTVMLASFDGEEAGASGKGTTAGSRAFLEHLGPRTRDLVAAFVIEMCGWKGGTPVLHPIQYGDPRRPGLAVIAPGWLVAAALDGSWRAGAPLGVGDPYLSWLYQPAVRSFRVRLYGDDLSLLQAGRPALFASDSSFSAFYPDYHKATDTAERLSAAALGRMGQAVLGVARALDRVARGPAEQPQWFAAFGHVVDGPWLVALGLLSLLPGLYAGARGTLLTLLERLLEAGFFAVLLWWQPVPALFVFLLAHLLLPHARRPWAVLLSLLPLVALLAMGVSAWLRGAVDGIWLTPTELGLAAIAFALAFTGLSGRPPARQPYRERLQRRAGPRRL